MSKYQFVNSDNDVISTDDKTEAAHYENMGYRTAGAQDIQHAEIKKQYQGWVGTGEAFGAGAVSGIPGAMPVATTIADYVGGNPDGTAANWVNGLQQAHPTASALGETAGAVAAYSTGEGLLAEAGLEGAGLVAQASRSGIVNALLGYGKKEDNLILQHAMSPAGDEHVFADLGMDDVMNAAIGAAVPVGVRGLSRAAGLLGKAGDSLAAVKDKGAILDLQKVNEHFEAARGEAVMQTFENKGYAEMTEKEVRKDIIKRLPDLEAQYNEIKANATEPLPASYTGILADSIGNHFPGELAPQGAALVGKITDSPALTIEDLHGLRQDIDRQINWAKPTQVDSALYGARGEVDKAMQAALDANDALTNGARAPQWKAIDKEYSHLKSIQTAIGSPDKAWQIPGLADLVPEQYQGFAKLASTVMHFKTGFVSKGLAESINFASRMMNGEYAASARGLGKVFNKQASVWSKAVAAGLYGAPEAAIQFNQSKRQHEDFDQLNAKSKWVMNNPSDAAANIQGHLAGTGADPQTATKMTSKVVAINAYLQGQLPQNPQAASIIPTHAYMPEEMKRDWVDLYNTAQDPTNAIANPTPANMKLIQQFYPEFHSNTTQAIMAQLQKNPDLPLESRMFASRWLGVPVDNLTSPDMYRMIQMGREAFAAKQAQAQQSGKTRSSGNGGSTAVNSNSTALQQLQGEDA